MKSMLVGFKRFKSKTGVDCCVMYLVTAPTERERQSGVVGDRVQEVFCPSEQVNLLTANDIGKDVELNYSISNGKAFLTGITVKK